MANNIKKEIIEYYRGHQILYNLLWSNQALHYGIWYKKTRKLSEAIENTNKLVSTLLELQKGDYVLDAGCGVGGSSCFMAKNYKSRVKGITICQNQLEQAKQHAKNFGVEKLTSFEIMDFTKTKFSDNTFTKIFGIEGVCYAEKKIDFLKEAYRILQPGGKVVIVDGFLKKRKLSAKGKKVYDKCLRGWKVPNLSNQDNFRNDLKKVGFSNIKLMDMTKTIMPSSKKLVWYGYGIYPFTLMLSKLRIIPKNFHENSICMINQIRAFNKFAIYGIFIAEK